MKKLMVLAVLLCLISTQAFAAVGMEAQREAHRQEMKAVKAAQREARKNQPKGEAVNSAPGFWKKEGERSGLSQMGNANTFFQNLNPMPFFKSQDDQYKARKASGQAK